MTETETLRAQVAMLREALNDATDAIDAVESEPGAGPMFKLDWTKALKALRDTVDAEAWLTTRDAAVRAKALEEAAAVAQRQCMSGDIGGCSATRSSGLRCSACHITADLLALANARREP